LDRFEPGAQYEIGNSLGALFLDLDEPALLVPFSETDPFDTRRLYRQERAVRNLARERFHPSRNRDRATAFARRRRKKR
jgi:hypothetical protein